MDLKENSAMARNGFLEAVLLSVVAVALVLTAPARVRLNNKLDAFTTK